MSAKYKKETNTMKKSVKSTLVGAVTVTAAAGGLIVAPLAYAVSGPTPVSLDTTVSATISSSISVTSGGTGTVAMTLVPATGGVVSSNNETITVATNYATGYTLKLADKDSTTTLVNDGNNIAASANTTTTPLALAVNTWGFGIPALGNFSATYSAETSNPTASSTSKWAGMPASGSGFTIKNNAAATAGDTVTVWYAANVDTSKALGTYTDIVTYTATNP